MGPVEAWLTITVLAADWAIRLTLAFRVVMRRRAVPVSLAWLVLLLFAPVVGAIVYLLVGETRVSAKRARRYLDAGRDIEERAARFWREGAQDWTAPGDTDEALRRLATAYTGLPPLAGNRVTLLHDTDAFLDAIIADLDAAAHHAHLLFYIWQPDGRALEVADAVERAARRGVECRMLLDAVGSKAFLRSTRCALLRSAGVEVVSALPVNPVRALFERLDVRNHRKIVEIDGRIAYTGSHNLTDDTFRNPRRPRLGPWIDASVRVEGPGAQALGVTFLHDWQVESPRRIDDIGRYMPDFGLIAPGSVVQAAPSGPGIAPDSIHNLLLTAIYAAREELILTTPYFVPDEAVRNAMSAAAVRGVEVTLIVPRATDTPVVSMAARSHYQDLLDAGVRIALHGRGLLHSKILTVDRRVAMIGSVNFDMRSFWLNFESTLLIYDDDFASVVRWLQREYMEECEMISRLSWAGRPVWKRAVDNTARLLSPLL
ncbi:MAG: cardiolipin synthase [Phycisphaerales bacterium]|nr:cardiolipin synthase [Phycisphaerales bacterium]